MRFEKLFDPISINGVEIKNRIAMAPINNMNQFDPTEGTITQRCVEYYLERAKGGVGLIITGVFKVENEIERCMKGDIYHWPIFSKKSLPYYYDLAHYAHSLGCKIFVQLSAGPGRVTNVNVIKSGIKPVSASANQAFFAPEVTCRALETEEVKEIVEAFGEAAEVSAMVGFDGIEVHGHEGYLIDQFTTALWNKRTDKYGGDLKGRLTFPVEILQKIKKTVGENYPVTYRYGAKHFIKEPWKAALHGEKEVGRDITEAIEMGKELEKAGYDALNVDTGCYDSSYYAHPPYYQPHGFSVDLAKKIKESVNIPVLTANRLGVPEIAEKVIKDKKADMIVLGRALLADPYWPKKVFEDKIEDIRPCIGCQEGCLNRVGSSGASLTCSVNPECGREKSNFLLTKSSSAPKKVVIVGGGVAGMEAAIIANERGHEISIFEKGNELGGQLIAASVPEFKEDIVRLKDWYKNKIKKSDIKVKLNTEVTPDFIIEQEADTVIISTGASPIIPEIPGAKSEMVTTCYDLYLKKKQTGDKIIVIGGGLEGSETALWLAQQGKDVILIEKLPEIATDMFGANRKMLLDMLDDNNVKILVNTNVQKIKDNSIIIWNKDFETDEIKCDTVVLAVGMRPNRKLYDALTKEVSELYLIGDSNEPRKIHDAIFEGYIIGNTI